MGDWELFDGENTHGPYGEAAVVELIERGLKADAMARPVGKEKWKSLSAHAPFAFAVQKRETAQAPSMIAPQSLPPIRVLDLSNAQWNPSAPSATGGTSLVTMGCAGVAVLIGLVIVGKWACSSTPTTTSQDVSPPAQAPIAPAPAAPTPTIPASVTPGTWAKIPMPGEEIPNTAESRVKYMGDVVKAVPGEPKINPKMVMPLLQRLRAELAKQASVPISAIAVAVGDASVSITVANGTMGALLVHGEAQSFGVCSEALFGSSLVIAKLSTDDFVKAGARALLCSSSGCVGVLDMRPTSPGGGIYGGDSCLSIEEMVKLASGGNQRRDPD